MKQQIRVMEQNSQEITVQNITITNEDFNVLQDYQAKLCRKLEWVETDKKKDRSKILAAVQAVRRAGGNKQ